MRGSNTWKDRILASLPYLVPMLEILVFGSFLFALIPPLALLFSPLFILATIYFATFNTGISIIAFVIFFALFIGVVRNETLSHFLRFHTMQALLLAVVGWLLRAFIELLGFSRFLIPGLSGEQTGVAGLLASGIATIILAILFTAIFLVITGASIYGIVQSLRGQYATMPLVSEAAESQVRY